MDPKLEMTRQWLTLADDDLHLADGPCRASMVHDVAVPIL